MALLEVKVAAAEHGIQFGRACCTLPLGATTRAFFDAHGVVNVEDRSGARPPAAAAKSVSAELLAVTVVVRAGRWGRGDCY